MFPIFNSQCANFVRFCIPFRCDTVKRRRGLSPPPSLSVFRFYLPRTSSKTSVTAFSGTFVVSETMTMAAQAARNAGSSS